MKVIVLTYAHTACFLWFFAILQWKNADFNKSAICSSKAGRLTMASKSIASARTLLTSEQFTPSDFTL